MSERKINLEEQKELELLIMDQIVAFCKEKQLRYYLMFGTLLGAVRHKGFIPWDDDFDIAMPREDYEVFLAEFNNWSDSRYKVVDYSNTEKYYLTFAKVIDTKTVLREKKIKDVIDLGIYIDIFPIDFLGDDREEVLQHFSRKIMPLRKFLTVRDSDLSQLSQAKMFTRLKWTVAHCLTQLISRKCVIKKFNVHAMKYKTCLSSKYCGVLSTMSYNANKIMESKWFEEVVPLQFESRIFDAPVGYENVLEYFYGDYMQLPPKEKRVLPHTFDAYWK